MGKTGSGRQGQHRKGSCDVHLCSVALLTRTAWLLMQSANGVGEVDFRHSMKTLPPQSPPHCCDMRQAGLRAHEWMGIR